MISRVDVKNLLGRERGGGPENFFEGDEMDEVGSFFVELAGGGYYI